MLRLRRLIRLLLDAIGNNVNMGRHCVFLTWCLFFVRKGWLKGRRGRGCCLVCGFVGGWLLGRRKSAKSVFKKSELAACCRSDSGLLKNNADSRRPRISSPPAEAEPDSIPFRGWCFQREKMSFDDRLWVVSAALDDCKG